MKLASRTCMREVVNPIFAEADHRNSLGKSVLTLAVAALRFWMSFSWGHEFQCKVGGTTVSCKPEDAVGCAAAPGWKTGASAESCMGQDGLMRRPRRPRESLLVLSPRGAAAPQTP